MKNMTVTQAEFGRLVGLTRSRINQLVRSGLLSVDGGGKLPLVENLKRYYTFRALRASRDVQPTDEYFQKFLLRI